MLNFHKIKAIRMEIRSKALPYKTGKPEVGVEHQPRQLTEDLHKFDIEQAREMVANKDHTALHDYLLDAAIQKYPKDEQLAEHHVNLFMNHLPNLHEHSVLPSLVNFQHNATVNPPKTQQVRSADMQPGMIVRPSRLSRGTFHIQGVERLQNGKIYVEGMPFHYSGETSSFLARPNEDYTVLHNTSEQENG